MNGQTVLRIGTKLEEGIGRIHVCPMLFIMKVHVNPRPTHTCVGRSFVIRFRELCAKLLCITHRT